jgi:LppP/LprE lipoprotein
MVRATIKAMWYRIIKEYLESKWISGLLALLSFAAAAQRPPGGAWLDSTPFIQWNGPAEVLPKVPADLEKERELRPAFCKVQDRPPHSDEERQVAGAGWLLFAPVKAANATTIIGGAATEDGMCRPDQYQYFVFVRAKFAGTLSPSLMRARADGSINRISLSGPKKIVADFSRYTDTDPLCCPSRISEADFEVRQVSGKPLVTLTRVTTRATKT